MLHLWLLISFDKFTYISILKTQQPATEIKYALLWNLGYIHTYMHAYIQ